MLKRIKIIAAAAVAVTAALTLFFLISGALGRSGLTSALPWTSEDTPHLLFETDDGGYPGALLSLLTDGPYAQFRVGSSRSTILTLTETAHESALLAREEESGMTEIYAAVRFSASDMRSLRKGELPDTFTKLLKSPSLIHGPEENTWILRTSEGGSPVYMITDKKRVVMAGDTAPFKLELAVKKGDEKSAGRKKWSIEKKWPCHMEFSDGGKLLPFGSKDKNAPLILTAAWHSLKSDKVSDPAGEMRWQIDGLDKRFGSLVLKALTPKKWATSEYVIPNPMLLSAGVNMPELPGAPEDWPFPYSSLGSLGRSMKLSDSDIRKVLAGQTVFSLGGQNRLLWFTLPGFLVELHTDKDLVKQVVSAFWKELFFNAEPKAINGYEYGGTASVPFSVIGAGHDDSAVLGLMSPESISGRNRLKYFLNDGEEAIGWLIADLPRIGAAMNDMTKMSSFVSDEDETEMEEDDENTAGDENGTEPFGTGDSPFSPLDEGITDAFGKVLAKMGRVLIVWETPETGRLDWYKAVK